ncbi:MAG TPA: hypothetical protein EYH01_01585 [Campylobacterales bacterium]|nr:hypothetical protein [Campylobacterales bacterium]
MVSDQLFAITDSNFSKKHKKIKVTHTVREDIVQKFNRAVEEAGYNRSNVIEKFMVNFIKNFNNLKNSK